MIRINLLPFRAARKKENIRKQLVFYLAGVFFGIGLFILGWVSYNTKVNDLKDREKSIITELANLEKVEKEIKKLEKDIQEIEQKLNVIKDLEKKKTGPVHLLDEIAMAVPKEKVWLTSLSEAKGFLVLKGVAMDNETVSLFMDNLEKSEYIEGVELESAKARDLPKNLRVADFVLNCRIAQPK